ncbi:MAG TPA: hypothetical protein VGS96_21975 [Thermoanaerobaculia bacterium]|jgi:hypothetical protein|nr:hypothetical protein [Thermoanaerobaculia bacterium]
MKKLSVLTIVALFVTVSAFAGLVKTPDATFTPGALTSGGIFAGAGPSTTNNDDSCDIGTAPAATLLLPYFEVDLGTAGTGRTTIFSITNVSPYAQIAHVVLYTDWSFPVLDFNIFLTGYDVQPINLFDVISRGLIGSPTGTSTSSPNATSTTGTTNNIMTGGTSGVNGTNAAPNSSPPNIGSQPFRVSAGDFLGNPNFSGSATGNCAAGRLPGQLPAALATDVRALLSTGRSTGAGISCPASGGGEAQVGGNHGGTTAIGYATIDVAATCSVALPIDPGYFTGEILFDNVLIGDYQDVNQSTTAGNYAGGNPLVHIRAIPEGGPAASSIATNLPFTFYDRYQGGALTSTARTVDRRQPLPSAFAARWISGSGAAFDTQYKIWREGFTGNTAGPHFAAAVCDEYVVNSRIPLVEIVRFDENENSGVITSGIIVSPPTITSPTTPETSRQAISGGLIPVVAGSTDVGGWTYFNLNNGGNATASSATVGGAGYFPYNSTRPLFGTSGAPGVPPGFFPRDVSQNWVILAMFAEGRFGVDQDANWLGNGCSPAFPTTSSGAAGTAVGRIAPAGGVLVCPTGVTTQAGGAPQCTGSNTTP